MRSVLGIDPGLSGALAFYTPPPSGDLSVSDLPTYSLTRNAKVRRVVDLSLLAQVIDFHAQTTAYCVLEDVHAMPGQGVSSAFKFGEVFGSIKGILAANFIPLHLVSPARWKKAMGLTADKDACRAAASRLLPAHAHLWPLKKHDGRAEAALLAYYAVHFIDDLQTENAA